MNSIQSQAMPVLQALWRHKWLAIGVAWLVCTAGWIGIAFVPTYFESTSRVYLNADPVLTPLLKGLAADTDPTRHLDFMQRTLLSRPNLEELVRLTDLDTRLDTPSAKEALYKRLAKDIEISPITPNLLTIAYRDKDPVLAKNVVQSLLTIFAEKTAGSSRTEMDSAQRFLDDEIASYVDQLRAAEKRRAELARKYPDIISNRAPDDTAASGEDSGTRLDQARNAVIHLKGDLADAVTKRDSLRQQLASIPPMLSVDRAPQVVVANGGAMSPDEARLADLRKSLDALRLKYTDQHPDVIATRAAIAEVEGELKRSPGGAGARAAAKSQIANSVYDQLKVKLVEAEGTVATTRQRLAEAETEQTRIEKIVQSAAGVVQQAQDLDRDYSVLKKNYEALVARREAAQIANAADTKTENIQFRIVDPPQVPVLPVAPNRALLVSVVLALGLGAGLGVPLAVSQLDRSFATVGQLRNLGLPILGSVSRLSLGAARRQAVMQMAGVCASAVVLIAVYGTLLALSLGLHSVGVS